MIKPPTNIQIIGNELAILWGDGREDYYPMDKLRAYSPSAENMGERDILGNLYGGTDQTEFPGVVVEDWKIIGNYAIQFIFSDRHNTGLYSFQYLRDLSDALKEKEQSQEGD